MFKIIITDSIYNRIINIEEPKTITTFSYLSRLLKQQKIQKLDAAKTLFLKTHPEEVIKNPSSLYILDISPSEALEIQQTYGVLCMSGDCPDISSLIDINDIHISYYKERLGRGWGSVLESVEKMPSNALLLTDRYLFAFRQPNAGDGIANIHEILNALLPQHFAGGDYHVTVVFDDKSIHYSYTFEEIATKLNRLKRQLHRDYPIMMEVLGITPDCSIYNKLHNRLIVSNYYLVEAGHKLAAFNHDKATARQMLIPMTLFTEDSLYNCSDPPLKAIDQTLITLSEFSKSLSRLLDHSVYSYAVDGNYQDRCVKMRNRLLD